MSKCGCEEDKPCIEKDCACKVFVTTDCVTLKEDLTCSNIPKGLTETEVLKQLDNYICERFETVENFFRLVNVGNGAGVYKGTTLLGVKQLRSLVGDNTISVSVVGDTIKFSVNQNNCVRNLYIDINEVLFCGEEMQVFDSLPSPRIECINSYIQNLPEVQKTLLDTDSKLNIILYSPQNIER